tara:strand:+ start:102 stop:353 length:252 start_codon:yes stop_codon:yes gene_type:complete
MKFIFVILAFILTWFFIEITLFIANKIYYNKKIINKKQINQNKFVWYLRIVAISLFFVTTVYMYFFENTQLLQAFEYCLGIVK